MDRAKKREFGLVILLLSILLSFFITGVASAQSPIKARVDRSTVSMDEQVLLTVTVTGEFLNIPTPDLPELTDFAVVSSNTSTQVSIINGKLTSEGRFVFRLQPLQTGNLIIPPIQVEIDGQIFQAEPINIEVVAGSSPALPPDEDYSPGITPSQIFVEAEVDNTSPYLGQQIIYTFKLYQATNFLRQPDYQPPSFTNFWSQNSLSQPHYQTTIGGQEYLVSEIRTALFPAKVGSITIDPAKLIIPGGLFEPDIVLDSEPVTVEVQSLPEGAPPDFKGAVGRFEINAYLNETESEVNEPITLVVEIKGTGNIEVLTEPALPELPNWRVFDSQASTTIDLQNEMVYGTRRFERLIVPGQAGPHTIPALSFSYYDPQAEQYRTVKTNPITVNIYPANTELSPSPAVIGPDKQTITLIGGDIRHIKPVPTSLVSTDGFVLGHPFYWSFWIWPLLIVGGVWAWQKRRQRLLNDNAFARWQNARRTALRVLSEAAHSGEDPHAVAQRALLGYLSHKLNQPTTGLTTNGLIELLQEFELDPILIERVHNLLLQIDVGRFAPMKEMSSQSIIADTKKLLNDLEKSFGAWQ